jgi:hypothetical protein
LEVFIRITSITRALSFGSVIFFQPECFFKALRHKTQEQKALKFLGVGAAFINPILKITPESFSPGLLAGSALLTEAAGLSTPEFGGAGDEEGGETPDETALSLSLTLGSSRNPAPHSAPGILAGALAAGGAASSAV